MLSVFCITLHLSSVKGAYGPCFLTKITTKQKTIYTNTHNLCHCLLGDIISAFTAHVPGNRVADPQLLFILTFFQAIIVHDTFYSGYIPG